MKICLFGGTFDPPHVGHLIIGETVRESEGFDKMMFVPAFAPPLKDLSGISSIEERLEMLRLCLGSESLLEVSDVEIKRRGISYTIDTIREMKSKYKLQRGNLCFLMGSDSLEEFHEWKDYENILNGSVVLVAVRPGFRPSRISPNILPRIRFLKVPQIEISSSVIRERIRKGLTVQYMVLDPVLEYIQKKGLYR